MPDSVHEEIKKELEAYIRNELQRGHSLEVIKKALLDVGHHENIVRAAIDELNHPDKKFLNQGLVDKLSKKAKQSPDPRSLNKESEEVIEESIDYYKGSHQPQKSALNRIHAIHFLLPACLIVMLVFMFWVSARANTAFSNVLLGFWPTLLSLVILGLFFGKEKHELATWIGPIVAVLIFYTIAIITLVYKNFEFGNLAALNLILSLCFAYLLLIGAGEVKPESIQPAEHVEIKKQVSRPTKVKVVEKPVIVPFAKPKLKKKPELKEPNDLKKFLQKRLVPLHKGFVNPMETPSDRMHKKEMEEAKHAKNI